MQVLPLVGNKEQVLDNTSLLRAFLPGNFGTEFLLLLAWGTSLRQLMRRILQTGGEM
jgi:hypothetical protein